MRRLNTLHPQSGNRERGVLAGQQASSFLPIFIQFGSKLMGWRRPCLSGSFVLSSTSLYLHLAIGNALILLRVSKVFIIDTI